MFMATFSSFVRYMRALGEDGTVGRPFGWWGAEIGHPQGYFVDAFVFLRQYI